MVSMHAKGEDDFRSGINVDLDPYSSAKFDVVNVEGAGTVGAQNLRVHDNPFAQFRRLCIGTSPGTQNVALYVDGQAEGTRTRSSLPMHMDEVIIGGRHYGGSEAPRGFFAGEIAEVLIFDRTLDESERARAQLALRRVGRLATVSATSKPLRKQLAVREPTSSFSATAVRLPHLKMLNTC